jgi:hypothetical protein
MASSVLQAERRRRHGQMMMTTARRSRPSRVGADPEKLTEHRQEGFGLTFLAFSDFCVVCSGCRSP